MITYPNVNQTMLAADQFGVAMRMRKDAKLPDFVEDVRQSAMLDAYTYAREVVQEIGCLYECRPGIFLGSLQHWCMTCTNPHAYSGGRCADNPCRNCSMINALTVMIEQITAPLDKQQHHDTPERWR